MSTPRRGRHLPLFLLLAWIGTGCYLPVSQSLPERRTHIPATRQDFTPGKTTRTDVLLIMGEPDERSAEDLVLSYRFYKGGGILLTYSCAESPLHAEMETATLYRFTFDDRGTLRDLAISFGRSAR